MAAPAAPNRFFAFLLATLVGPVSAAELTSLRGGTRTVDTPAPPSAPQPPAAPQQQQQRAKLDVGFADFEKELTSDVEASITKNAGGPEWSDELRSRLAKNVTQSLQQALQESLKPLKLSIGKTWVALPADDQKAAFVSQLRSGFADTLNRSKGSIEGHLNISLQRVARLHSASAAGAPARNATKEEDLLTQAAQLLLGGILTDHCYDEHALKASAAKKAAAAPNASAAPTQFCIPSAVTALAKRLNDTEGLVSMTMRFEARAMDLVQKRSRGQGRRQQQQS